jgi:hypothetical protein
MIAASDDAPQSGHQLPAGQAAGHSRRALCCLKRTTMRRKRGTNSFAVT